MEEDNKRQRLPSLPSNYVTILQLKERWIKDQKRKQSKDQQLEQKSEPEPNPQEQREIRDVLEKSVVAVCLASCETADMKIETEELKIAKRKWWWKKSENSKSKGRAQAATIAAEVAGGEEIVPQTKEASLKSRNGRRLRKLSTDGGREREREKNGSKRKPEGAVCLVSCQITDKKGKTWKLKKNQGKKEWKKVKEKRNDEEVAGGEVHAPKTSDEKEEMKKLGNAVLADQTVEIEGRLKDMSIKVGRERANDGPEKKPEGDVCLVSCQITDKEMTWKSKKNQGKREWKKVKVKEKRDDEEAVGGEVHAPKTSDEKEGDACLVSCQFTDKKENTWKSKKNQGKIEWRKGKEKKDDEEVAGCEAHVPKTSDEKEVMAKSGNAVVTDQMVEIEGRMNGVSIKGGRERGNDALVRPNNGGHCRGGYQTFDNGRLCKERKPRNAKMIWVKKGHTFGGNADEVHSSIVY